MNRERLIGRLARAVGCGMLPVLLLACATAADLDSVEDSVVKIHATRAAPDYFTPWRLLTARQTTGSGAVIAGERILTNAHVVANATYVQVQKHNDPQRHLARILFVSHEADLALLTVAEPGFFAGLRPLPLGELPAPREEVAVYGYPIGGKSLSVTRGILSRLEHQVYAHAGSYLFAGQFDAAINPGNSGGPVIVAGQLVGIVMQSNASSRTENLGYFVPPSVINHVLRDSEDGVLDGFPDPGFRTQNLDSPAAKSALKLEEDQSGVLVIKVFEDSPASGLLRKNDVILAIDGYDIADDGSIPIGENLLTNYKYAMDRRHVGETARIRYSRDGRVGQVELTAAPPAYSYSLVAGETFDTLPRYYIYGGVLFVPLTMNLIKRWGNDWGRSAPITLLQERNRWSEENRREPVVALRVLAADVNLGYHDWRHWIVEFVNGERVRDFSHFTRLLRDNEAPDVVFENSNGYQMVINHAEALASEAALLEQYRVPAPHSANAFADPAP